MNNFDDFFEKELNEEQQFPNSGANWGKLSQQLQSHDLVVHAVARKASCCGEAIVLQNFNVYLGQRFAELRQHGCRIGAILQGFYCQFHL
jgi:hypothetical protein